MLIHEWMTSGVISISPETSLMKASRLMKDNKIRRLPVIDDNNKVLGIVSDRDVKEASPSKATSLDMHELYYLLSELKVKDIMTRNPVCIPADASVDEAALLMLDKHIGGMPVINNERQLVGIITETDIFKVLTTITGVRHAGLLLAFTLEKDAANIFPVVQVLQEYGAEVSSIMTPFSEDEVVTTRRLYIRVLPMDKAAFPAMISALEEQFTLEYYRQFP